MICGVCHHKMRPSNGEATHVSTGYNPVTTQCICCGLLCGGQLGTTVVRSSLCHFTQQPQSILWHLQLAIDNASRQGTMQHQKTCRMATHIIKERVQGEGVEDTQGDGVKQEGKWWCRRGWAGGGHWGASNGQLWARHLAPAAPAPRPCLPSQFHMCPLHQCIVSFGSYRVLPVLPVRARDKASWFWALAPGHIGFGSCLFFVLCRVQCWSVQHWGGGV